MLTYIPDLKAIFYDEVVIVIYIFFVMWLVFFLLFDDVVPDVFSWCRAVFVRRFVVATIAAAVVI